MCGIVGYYGARSPKEVILKGLKTLEYRGYDSAGVAILNKGEFQRVRAEGKLAILDNKLKSMDFDGNLGIGHTRWATHGRPSEQNAHPHCVEGVSIVHNGIIENYAELRNQLLAEGAKIESETDSELVAHLIANAVSGGSSLLEAIVKVLPMLEGAYSILAVSKDSPDEMVAFKNGPPLIVGQAKDSVIVASDLQAIVDYTQEVFYLEDFEIGFVKGMNLQFMDRLGQTISKKSVHVEWSPEQAEKQGYSHFMLKEIFEQPRAVAAAMDQHIDLVHKRVELQGVGFSCNDYEKLDALNKEEDLKATYDLFRGFERIFIVACGTSYYAGMAGKYMIEKLSGVPVEIDIASEFRYRHPIIPKNSLFISISQSGETADTLAALRLVKKQGVKSLSICNVRRSTIDRESDGHMYMNAGVEIGVASTKAFACTLTLMNLLALFLGKAKEKINPKQEAEYLQGLLAIPSQMETVLAYDKFFSEAASTLKQHKGFLYMGRGVSYPIAMEGALKLKELAYMHAEGYASGEMKHGPLALIDEKMAVVMLAPSDDLYDKTVSNLEEAKARGGNIISIGTGDNTKLKELSSHYLALPSAVWGGTPILQVIPLQLLSYHVAEALGHDVDQPRNLAKSVTVE